MVFYDRRNQKGECKRTEKSNVRWIIPIMLFIAIMFNYADREIWTITAPAYAFAFGWTKSISSYGVAGAGISEYSLIYLAGHLRMHSLIFLGGQLLISLA